MGQCYCCCYLTCQFGTGGRTQKARPVEVLTRNMSCNQVVYISYNMGTRCLPDIYTLDIRPAADITQGRGKAEAAC